MSSSLMSQIEIFYSDIIKGDTFENQNYFSIINIIIRGSRGTAKLPMEVEVNTLILPFIERYTLHRIDVPYFKICAWLYWIKWHKKKDFKNNNKPICLIWRGAQIFFNSLNSLTHLILSSTILFIYLFVFFFKKFNTLSNGCSCEIISMWRWKTKVNKTKRNYVYMNPSTFYMKHTINSQTSGHSKSRTPLISGQIYVPWTLWRLLISGHWPQNIHYRTDCSLRDDAPFYHFYCLFT